MNEMNNDPGRNRSIAALVLGICGIVVPYVGLILSIVGLILGINGKKASIAAGAPNGTTIATAGIVLSIIGLAMSIFWVICVSVVICAGVAAGGAAEVMNLNSYL